jgi:hypothetical protein
MAAGFVLVILGSTLATRPARAAGAAPIGSPAPSQPATGQPAADS